jgi:hypothetical protein
MAVKHSHYARRQTARGQLRPLAQRLSPEQLQKRAMEIYSRRTVAEKLAINGAMAMGRANMALQILGRGFFGRLKWLVIGR